MMVSVNVGFLYMAVLMFVGGSVRGDVEVVQSVIFFSLCHELYFMV